MRISRLYLKQDLTLNQHVTLDDEAAHYVRNVLRLKKSAKVIVFNGQGGEWSGQVTEAHRKAVTLHIQQWHERSVESSLKIHLGLAVARSERMDWAIQKAVELGVNSISPIVTERCVVQFKEGKEAQKLRHWRAIVQNAAEQCGRTLLPETAVVSELLPWLQQQDGLRIFLHPEAQQSLAQLQTEQSKVTLLTGPEGGFTVAERELAMQNGFVPVRLGQRILRTETASLAAISAVQMLWGDFN